MLKAKINFKGIWQSKIGRREFCYEMGIQRAKVTLIKEMDTLT